MISYAELIDMQERCTADTGISVSTDYLLDAREKGNLITQSDLGFLCFERHREPDTNRRLWIERMLWVDPEWRSMGMAQNLLLHWQERAVEVSNFYGEPIILHAGATLPNPEAARHVYEGSGFRTTYAFQKEINNV